MQFEEFDVPNAQWTRRAWSGRFIGISIGLGLASLGLLASSCTSEIADEPPAAVVKALQPQEVLAAAQQVVARDRALATRFARRGWSAGRDGITSNTGTSAAAPGREQIASRLPALADGTWETTVAGSDQLSVALRVEGSQPSNAELVDGRVVYRETFPGTHTVFSADAHEVELNFMLVDARAPKEFSLAVDTYGSDLEPRQRSAEEIAFVDRRGRTRLLFGAPYAVDEAGQRRLAQLHVDGDRMRMRFDPTGMQYPILLDPPLGTPSWTQAEPETSPSARTYYGMATLGSTLVMFGGRLADGTNSNETWVWDGTSWSKKSPETPPNARQPWTQMATLGGSVVLFSGLGSGTNDTWRWDGSEWTPLSPATSPPFRAGAHMAAVSGKVILFGGTDGSGVVQGDMWTWDGTNWTDNGTSGTPPARSFGSITTFNSQILLFGGMGISDALSDTWGYDGTSWQLLAAAGEGPTARIRAPFGALMSSAVVFGGQDGEALGDTWEWDGAAWAERSPLTAPGARFGGQFGSLNGSVVLFGGYNEGTTNAETWTYTSVPPAANGESCTAAEQCESNFCVDGVCCNSACGGGAMDCQACNLAGTTGTCSNVGSGTVCRAAADLCDAAETCTGSSPSCPSDAMKAATETCRAAAGDCDQPETCDGVSAACPTDVKRPSSFTCRSVAGECDVAETCTGAADLCPSDAKASVGTSCTDDGNLCTRDVCDGTGNVCTHPAGNAGTECRASAGPCDVAESCDGTSTACPVDQVEPSSTTCRATTGECDPTETCDGTSPQCPSDLRVAADTPCTADEDVCTRDVCDGNSAACTHPAGNAGTDSAP